MPKVTNNTARQVSFSLNAPEKDIHGCAISRRYRLIPNETIEVSSDELKRLRKIPLWDSLESKGLLVVAGQSRKTDLVE